MSVEHIIAFNLADTFYIGQLGADQLAAMSFTFPVVFTVGGISVGMGIAAGAIISRAIGEGDAARVRMLSTNALILSVALVAIVVLVGRTTIDPLFTAMGAGPELLPYIRDYMDIWYLGSIFLVVPMVGNSIIRAHGDAKTPGLTMALFALMNAALSPLLVFGMFGLPRMEIAGAAVATVITRALSLALALGILYYRDKVIEVSGRVISGFGQCSREIMAMGAPAAATQMIAPVSTLIITALVARYGADAVAAFGVATRIEALFLIPFMALSSGLAPFVGQNLGAGRTDRVREALKLSFLFSMLWGAGSFLVLILGGEMFARAFNDDAPQIPVLAASYLWMVGLALAGGGVTMLVGSALNPLGRPYLAAAISFLRFVLLYLPLGLLLSAPFEARGVFAAAAISYLAAGAASLWAIRYALANAKPAGRAQPPGPPPEAMALSGEGPPSPRPDQRPEEPQAGELKNPPAGSQSYP
ncbi:MAG: MATE family efflux transporter [Pseudomonadota bacterium]